MGVSTGTEVRIAGRKDSAGFRSGLTPFKKGAKTAVKPAPSPSADRAGCSAAPAERTARGPPPRGPVPVSCRPGERGGVAIPSRRSCCELRRRRLRKAKTLLLRWATGAWPCGAKMLAVQLLSVALAERTALGPPPRGPVPVSCRPAARDALRAPPRPMRRARSSWRREARPRPRQKSKRQSRSPGRQGRMCGSRVPGVWTPLAAVRPKARSRT